MSTPLMINSSRMSESRRGKLNLEASMALVMSM